VGKIAVVAVLAWSYLSGCHQITPEALIARFELSRLRYQLSSITEAVGTLTPLGAAWSVAMSRDMVYIRLRNSGLPLAISPAIKTEFLRELADRMPGLNSR
jgi:hypothetical protein